MSRKVKIGNDESQKMHINVMPLSPHVVAYRMWCLRPGGDWAVFAEGHTADSVADYHEQGPLEDGTKIAYWLGVGSTQPNTPFRVLVSFSQNGKIVDGGACMEEGRTDDQGAAVRETEATLE